ncbi:hypothetical protein EH240_09570 [Mesorhizobium tamadayense]|uniref:Uncharacterized protein n=1 Tax=Mesorhizobium tamadayense TaxID=425306 RepID=A0A3P3FZA2_9HYPH|nr:hypothetical protein [Mesorhizobium tamadayense]RRI03938.1 hypothetical protein EH240_09570 [Mesorhizobium tamadayense]
MKILSIHPMHGAVAKARFDIEINEHLRLYGLILKHTSNGLRTHAPRTNTGHSATFHPELGKRITAAAVAALEGCSHVGS